jgi:aspartate aminotransferase-like enzyme
MTPGPVQIPEPVLAELSKPMIHHRTPEFEAILMQVLEKLKIIFQTKQPVLLVPATGSGAMEAALVNTLSPKDTVIAVCSGKFGERWRDMAKVFGMNVVALDVEWGSSVNLETLRKLLLKHPDTKAVLCQACETSTAVVHPIEEIAKVIKENSQALFIVDAISALGVIDLQMDNWGIDVLVGGSQKSFMLPAGLAMIALSQHAWSAAEKSTTPKYYFDLREELKSVKNRQTRFSTPVSHVRALNVALDLMLKDGLQANFTKFTRMARGLRVAGDVMGLKVFAKDPSPTVTAFEVPPGINGEKLRDHLESKYNITIMGGQDHLKGKIIRVGTLGYVTDDDVEATLRALALALTDLGHKTEGQNAVNFFRKGN